MKVAVVGCGGMGSYHATCYANMPGVTVVGVHDTDAGAMQRLADLTGAGVYASYEEMLERSGCEAVSIATPSHLHKTFAVRAAEAGKHVISEKPIALTLADAEEMIRVCEERGVRLFVGHVVRYYPEYATMKDKIAEGAIGRVGVAHTRRAGGYPGDLKPWFANYEQSGGVVLDLLIHDLDFLRWTLGEVRSVYGLHRAEGKVEYASATLIFEDGSVANAEGYWGYPGPFRTTVEIAGSQGVLRSDNARAESLKVLRSAPPTEGRTFVEVPSSPAYVPPHELELRDFVDCIRTGREPKVTAHDSYKALELGLAVMESARAGKAIFLDSSAKEVSR